MSGMRLSVKLIGGFSIVAIITLIVGLNGWMTTNQVADKLNMVAYQSMPSVQNLLVLQKGATAIRVAIRTLLNPKLDPSDRKRQYENIADARDAYTKAWKVFEGIQNSSEESALWKQFVPKWLEYREENDKFFKLSRDLEKTGIPDPEQLLWELEQIRGDHYKLISNVSKAILMKTDFDGGEEAAHTAPENLINAYKGNNTGFRQALNDIVPFRVSFHNTVKTIREMVKKGDYDAAIAAYTGKLIPDSEEIMKYFNLLKQEADKAEHIFSLMNQQAMIHSYQKQLEALPLLDKLVEVNGKEVEEASRIAEKAAKRAKMISIIGMAAGAITALLLGIGFSLMITVPIHRIVEGLFCGAEQVVDAAKQVGASSQHLAEGTSDQAAAIEQISSSLEEMSAMTRQNAENAGQANICVSETSDMVGNTQVSMNELTVFMKEISEASRQTQKIVKTIDGIAFQTNLLALNAAIEAARTGEAGSGFAVVADEVRGLALRASEAAKNTAALTEITVTKISSGADIVSKAKDVFEKVAAGAKKAAEMVRGITTASDEQAHGIDLINKAIAEVDKVTQQNAANAEECAATSEEMNAHSLSMEAFAAELLVLVSGRTNRR